MILKFHNGIKILIVSHDAGGAEIVASWVRRNPDYQFTFVLDGPAVGVFQKRLGSILILKPDALSPALVHQAGVVLTSTSWGSDMERIAISLALSADVFSISFLDHWCHYIGRFKNGDDLVLPDEIWVGDEDALEIAKDCFPGQHLKHVDNPYFLDIKSEFTNEPPRSPSSKFRILYICEAAAESGQFLPSGEWLEYKSMDLFLDRLEKISKGTDIFVSIRAHPAESDGKYGRYMGRRGNIIIDMAPDNSLIEDCQWSDWVVGMNSMALVVAMLGGKKVYYCNIGQEMPKNIPTRGMENLFDAKSLRQYS